MKFSCALDMVPGNNLNDKIKKLIDWQIEGVAVYFYEGDSNNLLGTVNELKKSFERTPVKFVSAVYDHSYFNKLCDSDKDDRKKSIEKTKIGIDIASQLGCRCMIGPDYAAVTPLPLFDFHDPSYKNRYQILLEQLKILVDYAESVGVQTEIEPINRYESTFYNTISEAMEICMTINDTINNNSLSIIADFFHMNIEESDLNSSIIKAKNYIKHIHLSDSNRWLPGYGHIDFISAIKTLIDMGYSEYLTFECGVPGDPDIEIPNSINFLKSCINITNMKKENKLVNKYY